MSYRAYDRRKEGNRLTTRCAFITLIENSLFRRKKSGSRAAYVNLWNSEGNQQMLTEGQTNEYSVAGPTDNVHHSRKYVNLDPFCAGSATRSQIDFYSPFPWPVGIWSANAVLISSWISANRGPMLCVNGFVMTLMYNGLRISGPMVASRRMICSRI